MTATKSQTIVKRSRREVEEAVKNMDKSVRIDRQVYGRLRDFCNEQGYKIRALLNRGVTELLDRLEDIEK